MLPDDGSEILFTDVALGASAAVLSRRDEPRGGSAAPIPHIEAGVSRISLII
jgi:hypothetical protein